MPGFCGGLSRESRRYSTTRSALRHTRHARPWALATAEQQIRAYARNPLGRMPLSLDEFHPVPDVGQPE